MSTQVYKLDSSSKTLTLLGRSLMSALGLYEAADLETWLASCKDHLFARNVLWITRQDWASDDQRSDIVGLSDNGDLVVAELKRGNAGQDAITQVLAYAAEYAPKTPDELASIYYEHSQKTGASALIEKASSSNEAQSRISSHVGQNEVNQSQILIVLAESFEDRALAICDYLSRSTLEATFSVELWQYALYPVERPAAGMNATHIFLLEQVLPPPSIRAQIEAQREEAKTRKWARDPKRIEFMYELQTYLGAKGKPLTRPPGASYWGSIDLNGHKITLQVPRHEPHPYIVVPNTLEFEDEDLTSYKLQKGAHEEDSWWLEFSDVDAENLKFDPRFGDRLIDVLDKLKPARKSDTSFAQG